MATKKETRSDLRNEDAITGEPGSHPVGTGLGAAVGGAATGAVAGAVGGPVGAVIGAAVGAVAGGYGGKAVAESIDPTVETRYWKDNYASRPYYDKAVKYDDYEPAYRLGWENYDPSINFEDREEELKRRWEENSGRTGLTWDRARQATRDAWQRLKVRTTEDQDTKPC